MARLSMDSSDKNGAAEAQEEVGTGEGKAVGETAVAASSSSSSVREFKVGDLVLAKSGGSNPWPCKVRGEWGPMGAE